MQWLKNFWSALFRPKYLTIEQMAKDIFRNMSEGDRRYLGLFADKEKLIVFHHTNGRAIRNHYKLWDENNPHTDATDGASERHPDQVSQRVIERVWEKTREWVSVQ